MLVRLAISLSVLRNSSSAERDLELLALRHQVAVLHRQVKRPDLMPADRMILAALGLRLPPGGWLFSPATLLRWHHELVRRRWAALILRTLYVLIFMEINSRRILYVCTAHPNSAWVT